MIRVILLANTFGSRGYHLEPCDRAQRIRLQKKPLTFWVSPERTWLTQFKLELLDFLCGKLENGPTIFVRQIGNVCFIPTHSHKFW